MKQLIILYQYIINVYNYILKLDKKTVVTSRLRSFAKYWVLTILGKQAIIKL